MSDKFSGKKVRALINDRGLKVEHVARRIGVTPSYLSIIFGGKRPSIKVIEGLCNVLGCGAGEFFLDND